MAGVEVETEKIDNVPKPKPQMIQMKNTQATHHSASPVQPSPSGTKITPNPPMIAQSPKLSQTNVHPQPPKVYPYSSQTWASAMSLRHHAAAHPHLIHSFEEQMKMATRGNRPHDQSPEFIQNLSCARAEPVANLAGITPQHEDMNLVDDMQVDFPKLGSSRSDGHTSLDASAQLLQHETLPHGRPTRKLEETPPKNKDDEHSDNEPQGSPRSSDSRREQSDLYSDEHQTKQLGASSKAKGKQRAEPEPEPEHEDAGAPLSALFEGDKAEIQHRPRPMSSLFYRDFGSDSDSDISEERAVPPPVRPSKRFRSGSNNDSGDENVPRELKRIKSEPIEDNEFVIPDSDGDDGEEEEEEEEEDNGASGSRQQTSAFAAREKREQREKEKQIQVDIRELDSWLATIERLYSDRKIMKVEDLNAQTLVVLKEINAKKWHYLKEVIKAGKLEPILVGIAQRKKSYNEATRDFADLIRDTFEQRFEGRSLFTWDYSNKNKVVRSGYTRIDKPRGVVGK